MNNVQEYLVSSSEPLRDALARLQSISRGDHVIVNIGTTVGHDTAIENYCSIAPIVAVSGNVHLCEGVEVGTGRSHRQGIRIERGSMVAMGSVLSKDVVEADLVMGAPARGARSLDRF
jgi:acyl-[acyl carrier protein]--UDP-N-acetylglucosamine O-acyltransferase